MMNLLCHLFGHSRFPRTGHPYTVVHGNPWNRHENTVFRPPSIRSIPIIRILLKALPVAS